MVFHRETRGGRVAARPPQQTLDSVLAHRPSQDPCIGGNPVTHFAIPDGGFSPAEAELAAALDGSAADIEGLVPLGLLVSATEHQLTVLLIAIVLGFDADGWWTL